jgi:inner membrane protein
MSRLDAGQPADAMPTIFSHGAVGFIAARLTQSNPQAERRVMFAAIVIAVLPDIDGLWFRAIPYGHPLGHRGFTHSLLFAVMRGLVLAAFFARAGWTGGRSFWALALFFSLVTASHGFFDALTSGGLGVAFFAPFDHTRYFLPWRPIPVSPLSAAGLLTPRGLRVMSWELALFGTFTAASALWHRRRAWRKIAASLCIIAGLAMWWRALSQ